MINDSPIQITGFDSYPEAERVYNEKSIQTTTVKSSEQETQTTGTYSVATQVNSSTGGNRKYDFDEKKLMVFLRRIMPDLEEELRKTDEVITDEGEGCHLNVGQEFVLGATLLHSKISVNSLVSSISFSPRNRLVVVGVSESWHEGWCCHENYAAVYSSGIGETLKFTLLHELRVSSCVRTVKFHPIAPDVLAAGLHSGEVVIWKLSDKQELLFNIIGEGENRKGHGDCINFLSWVAGPPGTEPRLITAGRDGRVLFWKVNTSTCRYEIQKKYLIARPQNRNSEGKSEHEEIRALSFLSDSRDFILAGAGNLFHCSGDSQKHIPWAPTFLDPVDMTYEPHNGIVTGLSSSKSSLFASCGTDGEIRVYKILVKTPLNILYMNQPLLGVLWIHVRCLISWGTNTDFEAHTLDQEGKFLSKTSSKVEAGISTVAPMTPGYSSEFGVAVGTLTGRILFFDSA